MNYWLGILFFVLCLGCGDDAVTSDLDNTEESTADPASSSPEKSPSETPDTPDTAQPSTNNEPSPAGCSDDGRICLIVSLTEDQGFEVKAVIKENGEIATSAQGTVVFTFASFYGGDMEGYFDADGEYQDLPDDASDADLAVSVSSGEAVLYDAEITFSDFNANVDASFILKARYETSTAEIKACEMAETINC